MSSALINNNQSPATIRFLGGVLIFIGLLLMGGMGALMIWINNIITTNGRSGATQSFNGSPEQARIIFLVLGMVGVFGLISMIAGAWQLFTGTRNKFLIWLMLAVFFILLVSAYLIQVFF